MIVKKRNALLEGLMKVFRVVTSAPRSHDYVPGRKIVPEFRPQATSFQRAPAAASSDLIRELGSPPKSYANVPPDKD